MPSNEERTLSSREKAFAVNLDASCYGTFAEIGAGQEVVRWFFQAGGAAGTVSKSISAYDMQVSDAIYGDCDRYVSRQRLEAMLEHEQALNRQRLGEERGDSSRFFAFADTVSARNYMGTNECHAWMGIRIQTEPQADDSVIIIHVRMLDDTNAEQQEALGIVGVNLVHGAYAHCTDSTRLITSLTDGLSKGRVEVDMIDVHGPAFAHTDNRILMLELVQHGLTGAAMFSADGEVLQPSEALRKRPLLVQRGRFRPITHVNTDMLQTAKAKFSPLCGDDADRLLPIMEISLHNLREDTEVCLADFLSRANVISTTGCAVMISDFQEYHRLVDYLSRYTDRNIGLALGLASLQSLFDDKYYDDLKGGLLESFGRLFKRNVNLLVYPNKDGSGCIRSLDDLQFSDPRQHLLDYLRARGTVVSLADATHEYLDIHSPDVLKMIGEGDDAWTTLVPKSVARLIQQERLFGCDG